jgi:redox-sensing transcriptional repressor
LAKAAGVNAAQLRKDLGYFGQFGTRGLGYAVEELRNAIREALGRTSFQPVVLVGAGNLGSALLRYQGFEKEGFEVIAAFDIVPEAVMQQGLGLAVRPVSEMVRFIRKYDVKLAILCVPGEVAQETANELVGAGVTGILNFSPSVLQVPEAVTVNQVDLALELENLSYFVKE